MPDFKRRDEILFSTNPLLAPVHDKITLTGVYLFCAECGEPLTGLSAHLKEKHPQWWDQCVQAFLLLADNGWSNKAISQDLNFLFHRSEIARALKPFRTATKSSGAEQISVQKPGHISSPSQQDILESLCSVETTIQLLQQLKRLKPSDKWLTEEIITGWEFVQNEVGDSSLEPIQKKRTEVADYVPSDSAAAQAVGFWNKPDVTPLFPGNTDPVAERRSAKIAGRKLVILWKGTILGEPMCHGAEWRLTIARADENQFIVVREQSS